MRKAEKRALSDFSTNKEEFIEISSTANLNDMPFSTIWGNAPVTEIPIPNALTTMGINSIYVVDGILFFEYEDSIMWTTPFGILYTKDVSNLEDWYRLLQIEDDWYYYRIVS